MHNEYEYERYSGYIYPTVTTGSSTLAYNTTYTTSAGLVVGPYSWRDGGLRPAESARPRSNRERLAVEVDKVCALARK